MKCYSVIYVLFGCMLVAKGCQVSLQMIVYCIFLLNQNKILSCFLDTLSQSTKVWQMRFNLSKCDVQGPKIHRFTLSATSKHMYLGVMLDDHLSWSIHVTNVANKATRMLYFLKRHLSKCSSNVKTSAYLLMVCPLMEYACVVWDPHYQSQVSVLEKIQRRAARWVLSDYSYHSSVSSMLEQLNWLPLAKRRKQQRLNLFYQIMNGEMGYLIVTVLPTSTPGNTTHST